MDKEELKPCPYCQSEKVLLSTNYRAVNKHYIVCSFCEMRGPAYATKDIAISRWNDLPRYGDKGLPNNEWH